MISIANKTKAILATIALLSLLTVGCSREEDHKSVPTGGDGMSIEFRSATEKTKAVEATSANLEDFRVSAVWAKNAVTFEPRFMEDVKVERSGAVWNYSPNRYWPSAGVVNFCGYSPANSVGVADFKMQGAIYDGASLRYNVTTDPKMQEDLVVAAALGKTASPVLMNFYHALSQVEFQARSGARGVNFRIRKIEMHNLDREGVLTGTASAMFPGEMDWVWSGNTLQAQKSELFGAYLPAPITVSYPLADLVKPEFVSLTDSQVGNLMVLPQTMTNIGQNDLYTQDDIDADENDNITHGMLGQPKDLSTGFYIAVTFDSETNYYPATGAIPFHSNVTIYYALTDRSSGVDDPFEFKMGEKYTFRIELDNLHEVTFTVVETDWKQTVLLDL